MYISPIFSTQREVTVEGVML